MARLRRMYARPLFVVVGIFGVLLTRFSPSVPVLSALFAELRLGMS